MGRIVQRSSGVFIVYVEDVENDWMELAEEFGMMRGGRPLNTTVVRENSKLVNEYGVTLDGVRITGRSVDMFVTRDTVTGFVRRGVDLVPMLNRFPSCSLEIGGVKYFGKFRYSGERFMVYDRTGKSFRLGTDTFPDLEAAKGISARLSEDNGDIFKPLIARFVYVSRELPRSMKAVGYFDLCDYLRLVKSDMRWLFLDRSGTDAPVAIELPPDGNMGVRIVSAVGDRAEIELFGHAGILDTKAAKTYRPMVVLTLTPLVIRDMKFPIQKVTFDRTTVFMTPMMSKSDAWETLQGGINLLEAPGR